MRQSMTGYAAGQGSHDGLSWVWDLRSVNGKGLDLRLRLPEGIPGLDVLLDQLNDLEFHSTAPRCNGAGEDEAGGED